MIRKITKLLIVASLLGRAVSGMLLPITFEEFSEQMTCSCLVEVVAVEEVTEDELQKLNRAIPTSELLGLNRRAILQIERWIAKGQCAESGGKPALLFSSEVHSSHPEVGNQYVILPRSIDSIWTEVVYGRSVWQVTVEQKVVVDWRNDFLITPLDLRSGETAQIPLAAVERLLARTLADIYRSADERELKAYRDRINAAGNNQLQNVGTAGNNSPQLHSTTGNPPDVPVTRYFFDPAGNLTHETVRGWSTATTASGGRSRTGSWPTGTTRTATGAASGILER